MNDPIEPRDPWQHWLLAAILTLPTIGALYWVCNL